MRLLHCSDLHGNDRWYDWIVRQAPCFNLAVISGDLLDDDPSRPVGDQTAKATEFVARMRTPLALATGNHDLIADSGEEPTASLIRQFKRAGVWVDGDRFEIEGHRFYCHGWDQPFSRPHHPSEIWITHAPPHGTLTAEHHTSEDNGDFEFGCLCANEQGPKIALCGHVHGPSSWHSVLGRTQIFNPALEHSGPVPAHVIIDLDARIAECHRPSGLIESLRLLPPDGPEMLAHISPQIFERLIRFTVSNQGAEGYVLSPEEVEEVRRRLWRSTDGT